MRFQFCASTAVVSASTSTLLRVYCPQRLHLASQLRHKLRRVRNLRRRYSMAISCGLRDALHIVRNAVGEIGKLLWRQTESLSDLREPNIFHDEVCAIKYTISVLYLQSIYLVFTIRKYLQSAYICTISGVTKCAGPAGKYKQNSGTLALLI